MADTNAKNEEELNIVIVEPGEKGNEQGDDDQGNEQGATGGEDSGHDVDLDDLDERAGRVDEELDAANTDAEREQIREQRKNQRKQRREQNRERFNSLVRENASLRQQAQENNRRLLALEGNQAGAHLDRLKQTEEGIDRAITALEQAHAEAVSKQDGNTAALASRRMAEAMSAKREVAAARANFEQAMRTPQPQPVNPKLVQLSREWYDANKWYKGPQSKERDSLILTAIDNSVAADGFDPTTPEYWDELKARVRMNLPHRANEHDNSANVNSRQNSNAPAARRQPVAGAGNNGADGAGSAGGGKTFRLSRERYEVMKETGAWDDPVRKRDMIRRFQEQDAKMAREQRR